MTEEQNMDMQTEGSSMTWIETWIKAMTQPTEQAYQEIANDPSASTTKAYIWIGISSVISAFVSVSLNLLFSPFETGSAGGTFFLLICGVLVLPIISVILFTMFTGISQGIAGMLGGTGSFSKLLYVLAAYSAPFTIVGAGLSIVPFLGLLAIPLAFYGLFLNVLAVKSVNQFSWGKAVASSFVIFALIFVAIAVLTIVVLVLLGPAIGNIFSTINAGI